jgi:hypothetical protein
MPATSPDIAMVSVEDIKFSGIDGCGNTGSSSAPVEAGKLHLCRDLHPGRGVIPIVIIGWVRAVGKVDALNCISLIILHIISDFFRGMTEPSICISIVIIILIF